MNRFAALSIVAVLYSGSPVFAAFSSAASMSSARSEHSTTLLQNGKVLVAAGVGGAAMTAELYDPATNSWSAPPNMTGAHGAHAAVLLPNGKVLVIAGGAYTTAAELFDPESNTWSSAGNLTTGRQEHTATLLNNGKVLVVGGLINATTATNSCEIYDPGTNSWSVAAGTMTDARAQHTATLLANGKVLVVAGITSGPGIINTAELYDPVGDSWSSANTVTGRHFHTATLLPDGNVLVVGGRIGGDIGTTSAELYNPGGNSWSSANSMAGPRLAHSASLLPSGKVLIAGGQHSSANLNTAEVYDPIGNSWSSGGTLVTARSVFTATLLPSGNVFLIGGQGGGATTEQFNATAGGFSGGNSLTGARFQHSATLLPDGRVLVAGGNSNNMTGTANAIASAEIYDPVGNSWAAAMNLVATRTLHSATLLPNGKVLVAGGSDMTQATVATAELYDPATNMWSSTGSMSVARDLHTATLLTNGRVLVVGGVVSRGPVTYTQTCELYDPATGTWSTAAGLPGGAGGTRGEHTATLLSNGKVLVAGGKGNGGLQSNADLYDPALNQWSSAGTLATPRRNHVAVLLPNGKVLAAGGKDVSDNATGTAEIYDPVLNSWSGTGGMNVSRFSHSASLLLNGEVLVTGGQNPGYRDEAETYNVASGSWTNTASPMATMRSNHTSTLLASGKVLVVGGENGGGVIASAERFDLGLGYQTAWQPVISTATSPLFSGGVLVLTGTTFKGISEASAGSPRSSASNFPVVQIRSLSNEQTAFLLSNPAVSWSNTSFTSNAVSGIPPGFALVTVFTNGIPSDSKIILFKTNAASTNVNLSPGTIAENSAVGTTVGTFSTTDPDTGDSFSYALVSGAGATDNTSFTISGATLASAAFFDFETKSSYSIRVRVTDLGNNMFEKALTIGVLDVNETPTFSITGVTASANPSRSRSAVTFTAQVANPGAQTLSYAWNFGDGTPAGSGNPVTHTFSPGADTTFNVGLTVSSGGASATRAVSQLVLTANSGAEGIPNVSDGKPGVANPLNGITVAVESSNGGVIQLNIDVNALIRDAFDINTDFNGIDGRVGSQKGFRPLQKFTSSGVFVAETSVRETATGQMKGKARKMLSLSAKETGETGTPGFVAGDPAQDRGIKVGKLSGKFAFTKAAPDSVSFSGTIELPAGMNASASVPMAIGIGNITDFTLIDPKGKGAVPGQAGRIKKLSVKYPKLNDRANVGAGQTARVDFTLSTSDMDVLGFDTEGVTPLARDLDPVKRSAARKIQVAIIMAGVTFEAQADAEFKTTKPKAEGDAPDSGAITSRTSR